MQPRLVITQYLTIIVAIHACVIAGLKFLTYPEEATIGQVYTISWQGTTGPVELYLISGYIYGSQDYVYSGPNTEVSWSPRDNTNTTYWYYFMLIDDNSNTNITTSPIGITPATSTTTTGHKSSITSSSSISTRTIPPATSLELPSTSTAATSMATPSQSSHTDTSNTKTQEAKLSAGAIVGISVGSAGLILLLAIVILLYRRQQQHQQALRIMEKEQNQMAEIKTGDLRGSTLVNSRPISYELSGHPSARSFELAST